MTLISRKFLSVCLTLLVWHTTLAVPPGVAATCNGTTPFLSVTTHLLTPSLVVIGSQRIVYQPSPSDFVNQETLHSVTVSCSGTGSLLLQAVDVRGEILSTAYAQVRAPGQVPSLHPVVLDGLGVDLSRVGIIQALATHGTVFIQQFDITTGWLGSSCLGGQFINTTSHQCEVCLAGTVSESNCSTTCFSCSPGTFSATNGGSFCNRCAPGRYQNKSGQTVCALCAPSFYAASNGSIYVSVVRTGSGFCDPTVERIQSIPLSTDRVC